MLQTTHAYVHIHLGSTWAFMIKWIVSVPLMDWLPCAHLLNLSAVARCQVDLNVGFGWHIRCQGKQLVQQRGWFQLQVAFQEFERCCVVLVEMGVVTVLPYCTFLVWDQVHGWCGVTSSPSLVDWLVSCCSPPPPSDLHA